MSNCDMFDIVETVLMSDSRISAALETAENISEISEGEYVEKAFAESANIDLGIEDDMGELEYDENQDDATDPLDAAAEDIRQANDESPVEDDDDGEMIDDIMYQSDGYVDKVIDDEEDE